MGVVRRSTAVRHLGAVVVSAALVVAVAGCAPTEPIRFVGADRRCAPFGAERTAQALVRCAERGVVYVETPDASGTGIVIERDRRSYVVTNSHVVDPWAAATVMVAGRAYEEVPVVGARVGDDVAVVGPLPRGADVWSLELAAPPRPDQGDEVYLVGYPGEPEPERPGDLHATISRGILSGVREVGEFSQTYLQTDAAIAGGQSGGPLFSARGQVLGISGLSFADRFALALSAGDVSSSVRSILRGDGDDVPRIPVSADGPGADSLVERGELAFADAGDRQLLVLPASDDGERLEFGVDPSADVLVTMWTDVSEEPLAVSSNSDAIDERLADLAGDDGGDGADLFDDPALEEPAIEEPAIEEAADPADAEVAPGRFEVDVESGQTVYIEVSTPLADGETTVRFDSSHGLYPVTSRRVVEDIDVGGSGDSVLSRFATGTDFLLHLDRGEAVRIRATSAQSDVGFLVFADDAVPGPVASWELPDADGVDAYDDGGGGLYGLDAEGVLESPDGGTYRIRLFSNDLVTVLGRLSITDCEDIDCG